MADDDRTQKIRTLLTSLLSNPDWHGPLSEMISASGFKLLRQVEFTEFPAVTDPERLDKARIGVILDTETTGVDVTKDKVIQLSMLRFRYDEQGILALDEIFDRYRDPGEPLSPEITAITGITDEMVQGKTIEDAEVASFLVGVDLAAAHNAAFDRKMVERGFPQAGFQNIAWHCSFAQIDWAARGANGRSLELLALNQGFVFGAHNAVNDIRATAFVLNGRAGDGPTAFAEMYSQGARDMLMVLAKDSPFESKDLLKAEGFSWSADGVETFGRPKVWYKVVPDDVETLGELGRFLAEKVYRRDIALPAFRLSPLEKYSTRKPAGDELFRTAEVVKARDALDQAVAPSVVQASFGF